MNNIQLFSNPEFGDQYCILIDGEPYFRAKELCESLGYINSRDAIKKHIDKCDVAKCDVSSAIIVRGVDTAKTKYVKMNFVNESGMYALIFGSTKKTAKLFKRWVTSELLPIIRKTGQYLTEAKTKELEMQNQKLLAEVSENAHKISFFDNVTNLDEDYNKRKTILISKVARKFKMAAPAINKFLIRKGVIIRVDGGYDIHHKYADAGIAHQIVKEKPEYNDDGELIYPGRIYLEYTPKGVELIKELLTEAGMIKK